ncbi:ankyrin repeat domain-containing protein [Kibdelosporangium philippinense]|uniref:Ankyrin repeat domain-containing protein n=1 Tax=Kibdelosporangium philippinense TaxID=211113 RepID=A0ABS8ZKM8_9PSEU|nr:ankyrin repeat domain-containing protein [Kibdelosporangium philippinense]MCE7008004.1 ankyrin repeat domain-containing protein [Kibdelosporangium philippinense]
MPFLPARPNLGQLRNQAKDLLRAAQRGEPDALARIGDRVILASAQLAIAREHGFSSWPALKLEVTRREVFNSRDLSRLAQLLREHPSLATTRMEHWCDHKRGADVLGYMAMLRFDHERLGLPADLPGTAAMAKALIDAGAPVDGQPGDRETPLITAASYGDAEVARVLIDAGADIEAKSTLDSGGVPGGTALHHAAVFTMTEVVDLLVASGARIDSLEMAATAGDLSGWEPAAFPLQNRLRALVFAADHERLDVIDALVAAGTPVNEADEKWQRMPLHTAAGSGRAGSVRRLLAHGADPNLRDPATHRTAKEWRADFFS